MHDGMRYSGARFDLDPKRLNSDRRIRGVPTRERHSTLMMADTTMESSGQAEKVRDFASGPQL